jgi:hypothetical protein
LTQTDEIQPIGDMTALETLLAQGYELEGPRKQPNEDIKAIERFFKKGHVFYPEGCLLTEGCQLVEPSVLSKGLKFAYRCEGEDMFRYHRSKYTLVKGDTEIPLYLKSPETH